MKISLRKPAYPVQLSFIFLIALILVSCSESAEPDNPKNEDKAPEEVVNPPIDQNPEFFAQLQGKWIYGESAKSSGRMGPKLGKRSEGVDYLLNHTGARLMDDYQGFIEFLADTTFIFNDPKVLVSSKWDLEYGKFQFDVENKKIILGEFGELIIQEINGEKVKFDLKIKASNTSYSLEGEKRGLLDQAEKRAVISKIWELSDENEYGREELRDLKENGVSIYDENWEIKETFYPEGLILRFTPSGTLFSGHILNGQIKIFDITNWNWGVSESTQLVTSYDYNQWHWESDDIHYELRILELVETRFVLLEKWYNDYEDKFHENTIILKAYK
ncbi:hypothetical protein ACFOUP_18505 [Belliella kenyensis]|uniref:Lipocalin-like domain-containing protein n=1 Tax=Belliella kenyensis TaxID=1472724 RepID=A0ABV8ERN3_9BACT|nr:hypothetical protein [Belliella kenyensis]MCH7402231.1 hypothetical protein [Belliella kenyensis]MDN3601745.1 hypothetical protein [Belliella kenyensis]